MFVRINWEKDKGTKTTMIYNPPFIDKTTTDRFVEVKLGSKPYVERRSPQATFRVGGC